MRYVLLEFEDDAEADVYVERMIGKSIDRANRSTKRNILPRFLVRGYFAGAVRFCECGPLSPLEQREQVVRGEKYGWWVHRKCRRPLRGPQSPRNLLDPTGTPTKQMDTFLHLHELGIIQNYPIMVH